MQRANLDQILETAVGVALGVTDVPVMTRKVRHVGSKHARRRLMTASGPHRRNRHRG
jgi:hypothetical protein